MTRLTSTAVGITLKIKALNVKLIPRVPRSIAFDLKIKKNFKNHRNITYKAPV